MTAQRKKLFERQMLYGLLERLEVPAQILPGDFEAPDLGAVLNGKLIGIEVTEIQKSKVERAKRAHKDDVVERVRCGYEANNGPPLSVCFSFNQGVDLAEINRAELSQEIVGLLLNVSLKENFDAVVLAGELLPAALQRIVRELRFWRETNRCVWQCIEASWVAPLTTEVLQERLDVKSVLLPTYRKKGYDAYWLLICAHPTNPACRFEAARDFDPTQVLSPFDRTFFYDGWQAVELGGLGQSNE
ncbi:hypothetical protein [Arenimonas sp. MALMAid1274]|uniref:hypothetical protein n=1 Tax=Arenimonas sp. MALMAid1274 TaxID=3411630 RepID=UPI003B9FC1D9